MCKHKRLYLGITAIYLFILLFSAGCPLWGSTEQDFTMENQTKEILSIHLGSGSGTGVEVKPGMTYTDSWSRDSSNIKITAKNLKGDIVYSKTFNWDELEKIDYKVVIK